MLHLQQFERVFMDYIQILKKTPLFASLMDQDIHSMLECLGATEKIFEKNQTILLSGQPVEFVGIVLCGEITIEKEDIMGNHSIIAHIPAPGLFAEAFACAGIMESPVTVRAATKSTVLFLKFKQIISTCPTSCAYHNQLIENMMKVLAAKNIVLNQKIDVLSQRSVRERILTYLLNIAQQNHSKQFSIPFSRAQMADYLSVDRSAMSRELSKMQEEGLIKYQKNEFHLLD